MKVSKINGVTWGTGCRGPIALRWLIYQACHLSAYISAERCLETDRIIAICVETPYTHEFRLYQFSAQWKCCSSGEIVPPLPIETAVILVVLRLIV